MRISVITTSRAYSDLERDGYIRIIEREYGMEVLAKKDKMPRDFEYKPVTLDDIMLFYSKGEKVC